MKRISQYSLLCISLLYAALSIGLIGCTRGDAIHDEPDAIYAEQEFVATVEGDSVVAYDAFVRLHYDTFLMNEGYGCSPAVYYDRADWHAMRTADIRLNDIPLLFDESESMIFEDDFTISYAQYTLPDNTELDLQPGDTLKWTVNVDADVDYIWEGGLEDRELPDCYIPDMPEDGAHISQASGLVLEQSVPAGTGLRISLYRDEARTERLRNEMIRDDRPEVSFYISPAWIGETLWLVANQNYTYETVRRIVIDE